MMWEKRLGIDNLRVISVEEFEVIMERQWRRIGQESLEDEKLSQSGALG